MPFLLSVDLYERDSEWWLSSRLREKKEKSSWVIPKGVAVTYGSGRLRELFITKFKSLLKLGFTNVEYGRKESFDCTN